MVDLVIDLGYVESSRFHTFTFRYNGCLATTRYQARKNIPAILVDLCSVIKEWRTQFCPHKLNEAYSEFFEYLTKIDLDSFGMESDNFFAERGWFLHSFSKDPKVPTYTVWNVANWIDLESDFLEWFGTGRNCYQYNLDMEGKG